jgi:hypothetical protein
MVRLKRLNSGGSACRPGDAGLMVLTGPIRSPCSFVLEREPKVRLDHGGDVHRPDQGSVGPEVDGFAVGDVEGAFWAGVPAIPYSEGVVA